MRLGGRAGPGDAARHQARHLRRARWRPGVGRVLRRGRARLRVVLALPRADRPPGRRPRRARRRRPRDAPPRRDAVVAVTPAVRCHSAPRRRHTTGTVDQSCGSMNPSGARGRPARAPRARTRSSVGGAVVPARSGRPSSRSRWRRARPGPVGAGERAAARGARPVPAVLRARPRPRQALAPVAAPGGQVPGVHRPRGRPPPHPAHPRGRGGAGRHRHRPGRQPVPARWWRRSRWPTTAATARPATPPRRRSRRTCPRRGYDHAVYGADVTLAPLNLCRETLDGVRNHSWRRPPPATPEGEVVAWADRIAYVCHDFEDAVRAGILEPDDLPAEVRDVVGSRRVGADRHVRGRGARRHRPHRRGRDDRARGVGAGRVPGVQLRAHLPAAGGAAPGRARSIRLLGGLVDHFADAPLPDPDGARRRGRRRRAPGSPEAAALAVHYVSGMTDRFALGLGVELLGWRPDDLPRGV